MNQPKIARTIEDARLWAATFQGVQKVETTSQCPHGSAVKIDIILEGQVRDSIIACRSCWVSAPDWVRVD